MAMAGKAWILAFKVRILVPYKWYRGRHSIEGAAVAEIKTKHFRVNKTQENGDQKTKSLQRWALYDAIWIFAKLLGQRWWPEPYSKVPDGSWKKEKSVWNDWSGKHFRFQVLENLWNVTGTWKKSYEDCYGFVNLKFDSTVLKFSDFAANDFT